MCEGDPVLSKLWMEYSQARFPKGYGGKDVNDVCVTSLDSYAAGCIDSYMKRDDNLISIEHYQILQESKAKVAIFLKYLDGEALEYFSRLHDICGLIINESSIA